MSSHAQDRINREKLSFKDSSQVLTEAIGWCYNKTIGEWIDYKNVISSDKSYKKDTSNINKMNYILAGGANNFISIKSKTFYFKKDLYNALIIKKWSGYYTYPSLRQGWNRYQATQCYIFDINEFNKIKTISDSVYIKVLCEIELSHFEDYCEEKLLDLIQTELSKPKNKYARPIPYAFPIKKTDKGDIRFDLPLVYHSGRYKYLNVTFNFNEEYFETDIENFNKILIK